MKFKVGDKVRIVRNTGNMVAKDKYVGQVHIIAEIDPNREFCYSFENCNWWAWKEDDLELETCQDKIVIIADGKTTKATLYHDDMKTVATARCAPEDTFDFNVGAKLAMERLMEVVNPVTPFTVDGFKVGDRVNYGGHNGTVICLVDGGYYPIGVEFDTPNIGLHNCKGFTLASGNYGTKYNSRWFNSDELTHGEAPKYYNGKVVCVEVGLNHGLYTQGKIYEFVDGTFTCDDGTEVHEFITCERVKSFNDWKRFSSAKWLEIKE